MHITFWEIMVYYVVCFSLGVMIQVYLSYAKKPFLGKILPLSIFSGDFYLGSYNFTQSFSPEFNYLIFIASLVIFVFLAIPALLFFFIDINIKRKLRQQKKIKQQRVKIRSYKRSL